MIRLLFVRSFGNHLFPINSLEKFSPLSRLVYAAADVSLEDMRKLKPCRVRVVNLETKRAIGLDPLSFISGRKGLTSLLFFSGLEKLVRETDALDTAELYTTFSLQCARLSRRYRLPLVVSVVESLRHHISSLLPPYAVNTKIVRDSADLFIAQTKRAREYLLSVGAREESIRVIYPGLDLDLFQAKSTQDEEVRILFVGNLTREKGLEDLLLAFAQLSEEHPRVSLWICGKGPLLPLVEHYARHRPIKWMGHIPWYALPGIYSRCQVFCLPSRDKYLGPVRTWEEQFGMVLVEAMAAGLPVVATDCGAIPEIVGERNMIVEQANPALLTEGLRDLATDRRLRGRVGQTNRRRAESLFDARKQATTYAEEVSKLT